MSPDADELAHLIDLTYAVCQSLGITTIGSVDVDKAERERLRRETWNEKRQRPETVPTIELKPRAKAVLSAIRQDEITMPDLIDRVAGRKEFRDLAEPRREIHKIVDRLVELGLIADRTEPSLRGGKSVRNPNQPASLFIYADAYFWHALKCCVLRGLAYAKFKLCR